MELHIDEDEGLELEREEFKQSVEEGSPEIPLKEEGEAKKDKYTDEEKEEYSKRVKKRIDKLTAEIHAERQARAELEQRLLEREQKENAKRAEDEIALTLQDIRQQRVMALNAGDYELAAELDEKLIDAKIKQRDAYVEPQVQRTPPPQVDPSTGLPEAQKEWLIKNDWFYNPLKAQQRQVADLAYKQLLTEGFDPHDEDTYVELDRRLAPARRRETLPPSGGLDRGAPSGKARTVTFTEDDKIKMRSYNLDPNNEKHRAEWLKNKVV